MTKVKIIFMAAMLLLFVLLIMLVYKQQEGQSYGYNKDFYAAQSKAYSDFYEPRQNIEEIRESNDPNSKIVGYHIGSGTVRITDYSTLPIKIKMNESFNDEKYPKVKIKLLKIDQQKNTCLIQYEGKADNNMVNPQWFKKQDAIFPSIYGDIGIIIDDIGDNDISISIFLGSIITREKNN